MPEITLARLKSDTYSRLDGNDLFYTPTEVTWAINEAIKIGNMFCAWVTSTTLVPGDGTSKQDRLIYRIPNTVVIPQRVAFDGVELDKVGLFQLYRRWPDWMKDTTESTGMPVARWCPYALDRFILHPADSVGGALLLVTGIAAIDPLVNDSDVVQVPKSATTIIADYAAHIVQCKLGNVPLTQSMPLYRNYEKLIKQYRIWTNYKQPNLWLDDRIPE